MNPCDHAWLAIKYPGWRIANPSERPGAGGFVALCLVCRASVRLVKRP